MDINGTHHFNASPDKVWSALHDGALLQSCVPGAQEIIWQGESAILVKAAIGLGPIHQSATLTVSVTEHQAPSHIRMEGKTPNVSASTTVDLAPDGTGTALAYQAHADLSGPLAAVAMLARPFVENQLKHIFSCLDSKIA